MAARLSFDERCVISAMVGVGASARQIADELGRHSSTVRREINRAGGRGVYRAEDAQTEAEVRARRPKVPKLVTDPQLAEAVTERLEMGWSPHAVAADLRNEGSLSLVCAETIYQACYEPCGARGLTVGSWRWISCARRRFLGPSLRNPLLASIMKMPVRTWAFSLSMTRIQAGMPVP